MLEKIAKSEDIKLDPSVWVEICHILQDVASRRYDNYMCKTLSVSEIDSRLHLKALYCLTCVVYRLRDRTPHEVRETLTAAARIDGQDGREYRIILGYALAVLRSAIPDWYAENESLLFGMDSPNGMNSILMRVCLHDGCLDTQTMEKYHELVLEALGKEVRYIRRWESETGNRMSVNYPMRHFVSHMLRGSRGYGIENSVRNLAHIGPDAVSAAGHEFGFLIGENAEKKLVDRGVQFWEAVLDSSPEPEALHGFGRWRFTKSVDQDTWERLMLRTCEAAGGLVDDPAHVIHRAWSDGNHYTKSGIRIIELVLRANKSLLAGFAVRHILGKMRESGVSLDIS